MRRLAKETSGTIKLAMVVVVLMAMFGIGIGGALAQEDDEGFNPQHGFAVTKGCVSPTKVDAPFLCRYGLDNIVDEAYDTVTVNSVVDTVHAASGDVTSVNLLPQLKLVAGPDRPPLSSMFGFPNCTGGTGSGTEADPWIGVTSCTLPFGSRISSMYISHYTVAPLDFNKPSHALTNDVQAGWNDVCNDPQNQGVTNCNPNPPPVSAAGQTIVEQLPSTTDTTIHSGGACRRADGRRGLDGARLRVRHRRCGQARPDRQRHARLVHERPVHRCALRRPRRTIPLLAGGTVDATGFAQGPLAAGGYSFKAHYLGDSNNPRYAPSDGPCEPLKVVDARIKITPATGVNGRHEPCVDDHGDGIGGKLASGTATASIASGPGSFVGSPDLCVYGWWSECIVHGHDHRRRALATTCWSVAHLDGDAWQVRPITFRRRRSRIRGPAVAVRCRTRRRRGLMRGFNVCAVGCEQGWGSAYVHGVRWRRTLGRVGCRCWCGGSDRVGDRLAIGRGHGWHLCGEHVSGWDEALGTVRREQRSAANTGTGNVTADAFAVSGRLGCSRLRDLRRTGMASTARRREDVG